MYTYIYIYCIYVYKYIINVNRVKQGAIRANDIHKGGGDVVACLYRTKFDRFRHSPFYIVQNVLKLRAAPALQVNNVLISLVVRSHPVGQPGG